MTQSGYRCRIASLPPCAVRNRTLFALINSRLFIRIILVLYFFGQTKIQKFGGLEPIQSLIGCRESRMPEASRSEHKIIVIDDDNFMIKIVTRLLASMGQNDVNSATNGKAAVKLMAGDKFDLVISDLNMPGMDGIELLRHMADMEHRPSVILMSGVDKKILTSAERLAKVHQLSLLGTMAKPVKRDELERLIGKLEAKSEVAERYRSKRLSAEEVKEGISDGRITVFMQPKIAALTDVVVGAEALARWKNDDGSILAPVAFVPVAEENGLMTELTDAVMDSVFEIMGDWPAIANNLKVSINVSIDNLTDVGFANHLVAKAKAANISLDRLSLEVTETKVMENLKEPLDILTRLGMQGIGLAIDDFGTGAAGFSNLQDLPFTELKIDRCFVHGASRDADKMTILQSIFAVAKRFEIQTVAEGVELQDDWDLVASMGCDLIQGYIIAKPMPSDKFIEWLIKHYTEYDEAYTRSLK